MAQQSKSSRVVPEAAPQVHHHEDVRTGTSVANLRQAVLDHLFCLQGRVRQTATMNDIYLAVAFAVRDRLFHCGIHTVDAIAANPDARGVAYLSAEFLMGPHLGANLINLEIEPAMREALKQEGIDLDQVLAQEEEPGLGNGGLGRLAACYMDSLATLKIPAMGYGIRYEFGIFDQAIRDGWQVEITDQWLRLGNPWEIARPERAQRISFGGRTEASRDPAGRYRVKWLPEYQVLAVPYDTPVLGYRSGHSNLLRLWRAQAVESFDFSAFNEGNYFEAVEQKVRSETISKILYPNDESAQGRKLRLAQQYFFASAALQDMMRIHLLRGNEPRTFHRGWAVQLNDTHPAVSVAELMRLLVDEHGLDWEVAWEVTVAAMGYTNHTLLPEALEKWSLELFGRMLPRHLEIIYEINARFLECVRQRFPGDDARLARMSLIDERGERYVRMAHLATVGSHAVNGVAALHTELLKREVMHDFVEMYPERFVNVTNGVTPRRFVVLSNPGLTTLISQTIGDAWANDLEQLRKLETFADDAEFQRQWREVKTQNKRRLAELVRERVGVSVDPESLFDIQVKRIHEYKRQHLNVLHILTQFLRLKRNPRLDMVPRTFVFGGKAAPGYATAKLMIKLVHSVGDLVNNDADVRGRLKVVFFPDFNVKNAQAVYPAADLSEQISTAGKEASGTGNMKFSLNGALTIGTLDGANVEIREAVGEENFFLFGLTAEQVMQTRAQGYNPRRLLEDNTDLREVLDLIGSPAVGGAHGLFQPLVNTLLSYDPYLLLADYAAYIQCQDRVDQTWRNKATWTRMSILNTARMGRFSSDRSINDYCRLIWKAKPLA